MGNDYASGSPLLPKDSNTDHTDDTRSRNGKPAPMGISPQLPARAMRSVIKRSMCAVVMLCINWLPQVVRAVWVLWLTDLLRGIAGPAEIPITKSWRELISLDHDNCRPADEELTAVVIGHPGDGISDHFRLVNRRYRLRLVGEAALHPAELRCVDGRELHHRDRDLAFLVDQLSTYGLREALDGMLGPTIGRLQGNSPIGQRPA